LDLKRFPHRERGVYLKKTHATTDTVLTNKKLLRKSQEYRPWQGRVFLHILHSFCIRLLVWLPKVHLCLTDSNIPDCLDDELQFQTKKKKILKKVSCGQQYLT